MIAPLVRYIAALALALGFFVLQPAWGGEHGGGSGPATLGFVVNLASPDGGDRFLKLDLVLETAGPEVDHEVTTFMPRIMHHVILLLSGETDTTLRTLAGKHGLAEKVRSEVNKILGEDEKTGVKEVLFTTFLIQ